MWCPAPGDRAVINHSPPHLTPRPEVMSCRVHYVIVCLITPFSVGFPLMKIITGQMERNMGVCAGAADRILRFVTTVIRISTSEMNAEFSSGYLEARDRFENVKGKAIPLQAWSGSEGSWKLRFPDFVTTTQDGGKVVSLTHRPLYPQ